MKIGDNKTNKCVAFQFIIPIMIVGALFCLASSGSATERFIKTDTTVTDTSTGLMWANFTPALKMDFSHAKKYARRSSFAGHTDWRLPTIEEFKAIGNASPFEVFDLEIGEYTTANKNHKKNESVETIKFFPEKKGVAVYKKDWRYRSYVFMVRDKTEE